ncbi:MAG TPA: RNA polymerase sigma factor [Pyrinomonadaceae bacterium]|nr:RNA polymerase sigma factor [Pyrinomonadaceae bacterium]
MLVTFSAMRLVNIVSVNKTNKKFTANDFAAEHRLENYEKLPDSDLTRRAGAGDESAFAEIVRRYSPRVFRFAGRFFRRQSLVEEAAQEVFLKIFTQLGSFENRGSFEGWLTRITVNTCINLLRSAKRETELTVSALSDEESDWLERQMSDAATVQHRSAEEKTIAADLVNRVLEKMSPDDRLVLTLIDGEGHSIKELAEITGWTESKVKVQAFRARRKMREAVERLLEKSKLQKALTK